MHIAATRGLTGAVALLLKHGAVLDATNLCGDTALGLAALFGHLKCIKLLLRAGTLFGSVLQIRFCSRHTSCCCGERSLHLYVVQVLR